MPLPSELQILLYQNGGTVTTAQANDVGISNERLRLLVGSGNLERAGHGVYISPVFWHYLSISNHKKPARQ